MNLNGPGHPKARKAGAARHHEPSLLPGEKVADVGGRMRGWFRTSTLDPARA